MNLEDVLDPDYGLQQDEWSLRGDCGQAPTFGEEGQLEVVGWSGRDKRGVKNYILKCSKCPQDNELFDEGYFISPKGSLVKGSIPCGCSKNPKWSQEQLSVLCSRKAVELGYTFSGFIGEWKGTYTKIRMLCEIHGEWGSGSIDHFINRGVGCPGCKAKAAGEASKKPDNVMISSFHKSEAFHPETKFCRSGRLSSCGFAVYWHLFCPECGETGEATSSCLQKGHRPCACSPNRQRECYINWIVDDRENAVAIKFGIANNSKQRIKNQDRQSAYEVRQHQVYTFPSVQQCKQAERECKKELECGVVLKRDMPDGWTETTWSYNIGQVKSIYERNGGVLV